jgi:hypothetical protein
MSYAAASPILFDAGVTESLYYLIADFEVIPSEVDTYPVSSKYLITSLPNPSEVMPVESDRYTV